MQKDCICAFVHIQGCIRASSWSEYMNTPLCTALTCYDKLSRHNLRPHGENWPHWACCPSPVASNNFLLTFNCSRSCYSVEILNGFSEIPPACFKKQRSVVLFCWMSSYPCIKNTWNMDANAPEIHKYCISQEKGWAMTLATLITKFTFHATTQTSRSCKSRIFKVIFRKHWYMYFSLTVSFN